MALPASGTITLLQIATEFGGTAPHSLSEYYAAAAGVPASGAISFSDFYGKSAEAVSISNLTVSASGSPTQTATYTLESDGDVITTTTDFGSFDQGDWITPKAAAPSDYQVRATVTSGDLSSGTAGSWLALTSNRSWSRSRATEGSDTCVLTIEIRKGTGSVLATATITLYAEALGGL